MEIEQRSQAKTRLFTRLLPAGSLCSSLLARVTQSWTYWQASTSSKIWGLVFSIPDKNLQQYPKGRSSKVVRQRTFGVSLRTNQMQPARTLTTSYFEQLLLETHERTRARARNRATHEKVGRSRSLLRISLWKVSTCKRPFEGDPVTLTGLWKRNKFPHGTAWPLQLGQEKLGSKWGHLTDAWEWGKTFNFRSRNNAFFWQIAEI